MLIDVLIRSRKRRTEGWKGTGLLCRDGCSGNDICTTISTSFVHPISMNSSSFPFQQFLSET